MPTPITLNESAPGLDRAEGANSFGTTKRTHFEIDIRYACIHPPASLFKPR